MFTTDDFDRHDERYRFVDRDPEGSLTQLILTEYEHVRKQFGGDLEALRAYAHEEGAKDAYDLDSCITECYATYLTDDLMGQAQHDRDMCGISDLSHDVADQERRERSGDLEHFWLADGFDVAAFDLADRHEMLSSSTYALTDPATGVDYFFHI